MLTVPFPALADTFRVSAGYAALNLLPIATVLDGSRCLTLLMQMTLPSHMQQHGPRPGCCVGPLPRAFVSAAVACGLLVAMRRVSSLFVAMSQPLHRQL
eukprot:scaffold7729_cov471-Prasinococcus_capsulatus_cf.AAC.4